MEDDAAEEDDEDDEDDENDADDEDDESSHQWSFHRAWHTVELTLTILLVPRSRLGLVILIIIRLG